MVRRAIRTAIGAIAIFVAAADPTPCDAVTAASEPCPAVATFAVELPGDGRRRLCGPHTKAALTQATNALRGTPAPTDHQRGRWTPAEDAYLGAHPDAPARLIATQLGRTTKAVHQRRWTLRQEGRG